MKTVTKTVYAYNELSPEAKERAIENLIVDASNDPYILEHITSELLDSLKAIAEAAGVKVRNWSVGAYNRNACFKVEDHWDKEDETGNKALARFLNVLILHGYTRPKKFADMEFPGHCGFTGVCYDEDMVEAIWKSLLDGNTLEKAFDMAGDEANRICDRELEYLTSKEAVSEALDKGDERFTEDGELDN